MPQKLTPERARDIAMSKGFLPLESYQGLRTNWRCKKLQCGHEFYAKYESIQQETQGCPYCSGHSVLKGFNDFASKFPEFAAQADGWDPTTVTSKSGKRMQWRCALNHSWTAQVASRAYGSGCIRILYMKDTLWQKKLNVLDLPSIRDLRCIAIDTSYGFPQLLLRDPNHEPSRQFQDVLFEGR